MKLRELKWKDVPVWPPLWLESLNLGADEKFTKGEEGVLKGVQIIPGTEVLRIDAECAGSPLTGMLLIENFHLVKSLVEKLQDQVGKPLAEIGDLEINLKNFAS